MKALKKQNKIIYSIDRRNIFCKGARKIKNIMSRNYDLYSTNIYSSDDSGFYLSSSGS